MSTANAYNFVFDRSGLAWFVVGLLLAGSLLFFAGLLIGVNWGLPLGGESLASVSTAPVVRPRSERLFVDRPTGAATARVPSTRVQTRPAAASLDVSEEQAAPGSEPPASPATNPPEVVPVEPPTPAPAVVAAPVRQRQGWVVQAGAFTVRDHVETRLADLARIGFEASTQEMEGSRGQSLIAVRLGPYPTRAEAEDVAAEIGRRGGIVSFVRER